MQEYDFTSYVLYTIQLRNCALSCLFRSLRLVDIKDIKRRPEALELAVFQNIVMKHIELARETLIKK